MSRLAIVVVNYGSSALLEANLPAAVLEAADARLVVVDNYSSDAERAALLELGSARGWTVVTAPNEGFGAGMNRGVRAAAEQGASEVLLLNPDVVIDAATIRALADEVRADPRTLAAPRLLDPAGRPNFRGALLDLDRGRIRAGWPGDGVAEFGWLTGACIATSVAAFEELGGFADDYFMYWEDVDLCWRASRAGMRLVLRDDLTAVHDTGGTQDRHGRAKSDLYYRYNARNRLLFARRNLDRAARRRWARQTGSETRQIWLRGGRRQLLSHPMGLVAAVGGALSGLRLLGAPRASQPADHDRLVVLQSFPTPRETTNPYIVMLNQSLQQVPGLEVRTFSWRHALLGRYDVFHAHWPEILADGSTPLRKLARQLMFAAFLARMMLTGTTVVRTRHNLGQHEGKSRRERALLAWFEAITCFSILLNPDTPVSPRQGSRLIRHGHYRDWYATYPAASRVPGRLSYFGLIRPYKNVGRLIEVFRSLPDPEVSLVIAGKPATEELAAELRAAADGDPRIVLDLRFLSDEELVRVATEAELVVLAYQEMHNSGAMLAALSLDRPVLAPTNAVNTELADEVGAEWVLGYSGELTTDALATALDAAGRLAGSPDLGAREWADCGRQHAEAYRAAVRRRHRSA